MSKKIVYIDMDGVIVDFKSAFPKVDPKTMEKYIKDPDEIPGIFSLMEPMPGAIKSVEFLAKHFDIYVLSTASWKNPSAWSDKLKWITKYLPEVAHKRLILSHNKHLNIGDYLIDDNTRNGAGEFKGEHIHFGLDYKTGKENPFPTWKSVLDYLEQSS